jgi:alpha-mannosidase
MQIEKHQGELPPEKSFVEPKAENIIVSALKKAEDDHSLILRYYEWAGKGGDVELQVPPGANSAIETNLMEKGSAALSLHDGTLQVHTKPYEIETVKLGYGSADNTNGTANK